MALEPFHGSGSVVELLLLLELASPALIFPMPTPCLFFRFAMCSLHGGIHRPKGAFPSHLLPPLAW
ncbi:MAG: hypothetical protein MI919_11515, partial [Holophagales bacterium]|nr:hypothetical protein [Holophagales bacterium]